MPVDLKKANIYSTDIKGDIDTIITDNNRTSRVTTHTHTRTHNRQREIGIFVGNFIGRQSSLACIVCVYVYCTIERSYHSHSMYFKGINSRTMRFERSSTHHR